MTVCLGFSTGHRCPAVTNSSSARPSSEPLARVMRTVRLISLRRVLAFSASRQEARPAPSCPAQADEIRRQDGYLPALQVSDHLTTLRAVLRRQHLVRRRGLVLPASERWAPAGELSKHTRCVAQVKRPASGSRLSPYVAQSPRQISTPSSAEPHVTGGGIPPFALLGHRESGVGNVIASRRLKPS